MEIELKLALDPGAAAALREHPLLASYRQQAPKTRRLENHYFDTPSLELQRAGVEWRLRRVASRQLQTVKAVRAAKPSAGGLRRLDEWELPQRGPTLDLALMVDHLLPHEAALSKRLTAAAAGSGFGVQVTTRYTRTTWPLLSANGDEVELALDAGFIEAAGQSLPFCEVEIELKSGTERALFELAGQLHAELPLKLEHHGKAERGFALLAPRQAHAPRTAHSVPLKGGMPWPEALRLIVEECLTHVQANETGVLHSSDAEYVHQMRVGLRRLRSALSLFKSLAQPPAAMLDDLRWSTDPLGLARDAEVLAHETLAGVPAPLPEAVPFDWPALCAAAAAAAHQARRHAAQALAEPRHLRWQLALMAWVSGLADAPGLPVNRSKTLTVFAERQLQRLRKQLAKSGRRLPGVTAADRHATRIAAKKLRYASDMLGDLAGARRRPHRRRARTLAALQQHLGLLNDADVATVQLGRIVADNPALAQAAAYAQGWLAAEAVRRVQQIPKLWQRVGKDL